MGPLYPDDMISISHFFNFQPEVLHLMFNFYLRSDQQF